MADVGDGDNQAVCLGAALTIHRVVEVARGFAVDRHQWQRRQVGAALAVGLLHFLWKACRLALRGGGEPVGQVVLAQRDLDFHPRIGIVAQDLDHLRQRFTMRGRLFDHFGDDDLTGPRAAAHVGRDEDILADALVFRDQIPDAALLVDATDDFTVGALEHVDNRAFRPAAAVDSDQPRGRAIAVQRLVHLFRRQEQVRASVVGNEKSEAVGVALHRAGHQVELGDDAKLALAIGHQLAVALHRRYAPDERLAFGLAMHREEFGELFGGHRHALLAQRPQYLFALRYHDIVPRAAGAATGRRAAGRAASMRSRRRFVARRPGYFFCCSLRPDAGSGGAALLF